jgi:hypothetical protein
MEEILAVKRLSANRTICISTLTREQLDDAAPEYTGDDFGYFIYEVDHSRRGGIIVLARVLSVDAAFRILKVVEDGFGVTADPICASNNKRPKHIQRAVAA